jgi:hypothetical protein
MMLLLYVPCLALPSFYLFCCFVATPLHSVRRRRRRRRRLCFAFNIYIYKVESLFRCPLPSLEMSFVCIRCGIVVSLLLLYYLRRSLFVMSIANSAVWAVLVLQQEGVLSL